MADVAESTGILEVSRLALDSANAQTMSAVH